MDLPEGASWLELEKYGIPERVFGGVSMDLSISIGVIAMLGALVEHKIENLWVSLKGKAAADKGPFVGATANIDACKKRLHAFDGFLKEGEQDRYRRETNFRENVLPLLEAAAEALGKRHEIVHRVWSEAGSERHGGYKTPPPGDRGEDKLARPYRQVPTAELQETIAQLVEVIQGFDGVIGFTPPGFADLDPGAQSPIELLRTPEPPYAAVILTSVRTKADNGYARMAAHTEKLAAVQPGYLGHESAGSDGIGITVSYWATEADAGNWTQVTAHSVAQNRGRDQSCADYQVRIAVVMRQYGTRTGTESAS